MVVHCIIFLLSLPIVYNWSHDSKNLLTGWYVLDEVFQAIFITLYDYDFIHISMSFVCTGQVHIRICYVWHDNSTVATMRIMPISIWPIYDRCVRRKLVRIAIHYFLFEGVWIPRSEMSIGEAEIVGASSGNAVDVWYYDIILVEHVTVHVMMHNNLSDPESNIYIYIYRTQILYWNIMD